MKTWNSVIMSTRYLHMDTVARGISFSQLLNTLPSGKKNACSFWTPDRLPKRLASLDQWSSAFGGSIETLFHFKDI